MSNKETTPQVERTVLRLFRNSLGEGTHGDAACLHDDQWSELGQLAKIHGIVPWMLHHLPPATVQTLPASLVSDWKTWEQQNRLRILANWSVAIRVLGVLDSARIRAMPIKGVALSQQLYGNPWLRSAGDVDVLIERSYVQTAHAAMLGAGFMPNDLFSDLSASQWRWLLNNDHEACYRDRQSGLLVELHWRIHGNGLLNNLDELWIHAADDTRRMEFRASLGMTSVEADGNDEIEVLGRKVPVLPTPILYLMVMSHLARNRWSRLIWVLDSWKALEAARATHTEAELAAIIERHGAVRIHRQFLQLMQRLLEDDQLNQWPPPEFCSPLGHMRTWGPWRKGWDGLRFQLGLRGALRYKLMVLRGYLIATNDFSVFRLPGWLFWLYAPLRIPLYVYRRYLQRSGK